MRYQRQHKSKSFLARALGMSPSTLRRQMKKHSVEIINLYPGYNPRASLLPAIIIDYLLKINGNTWEDIFLEEDKLKPKIKI